MKRIIKASDITQYRNNRNPNKYVEVKNENDGHNAVRQYMKWNTPDGEVKNYTGAKNPNKGRFARARKNTINDIVSDYTRMDDVDIEDADFYRFYGLDASGSPVLEDYEYFEDIDEAAADDPNVATVVKRGYYMDGDMIKPAGQHVVKTYKRKVCTSAEIDKDALVLKIAKQADLTPDEVNELTHDLNNLRGDEWIDIISDSCDENTCIEYQRLIRPSGLVDDFVDAYEEYDLDLVYDYVMELFHDEEFADDVVAGVEARQIELGLR